VRIGVADESPVPDPVAVLDLTQRDTVLEEPVPEPLAVTILFRTCDTVEEPVPAESEPTLTTTLI
jgi:hypothetical protein